MSASPYATNKLLHHPDLLNVIRIGALPSSPRVVHFMPELHCTHRCRFCAYQSLPEDGDQSAWKNKQLQAGRERLTREQGERFVDDFESMGGRAIELTGGGEPLLWPHVAWFFDRLAAERSPLELALVTMGTMLDGDLAEQFGRTRWKWSRVSIDAGAEEQYVRTRRVKASEWVRAWGAVGLLARERDRGGDPERRVGVGYVVDAGNFDGVYRACGLARDRGADNVRVSLAFTPQHLGRFPPGAVEEASFQAAAARADMNRDGFEVYDLVSERHRNLAAPRQDYPYCAAKDVLCVVGGDARVYTCCSLAFNPRGLIGSIEPDGFRALWERTMPRFSAGHDPRRDCPVECLYERRNKEALSMLDAAPEVLDEERQRADPPPHVNFL